VAHRWPVSPEPHRSTITRWLNRKTLPHRSEQLLAFAGALDLDPVALWRVGPGSFLALRGRVAAAMRTQRWSSLDPSLAFLAELFEPSAEWPPARVARRFFHRAWTVRSFEHDGRFSNRFVAIVLSPQHDALDQVWHFAWKDPRHESPWRPYGFVHRSEHQLNLFSLSGREDAAPAVGSRVAVETWFGQGIAQFAVVSLHPFELLLDERVPDGLPSVRFDIG
jgi:hypothetical protein